MSDELDEIVDNLREPSSWIRIVFMVAFAVVLYLIIAPVILVIMIAQVFFAFIAGAPNSNLRDFSSALSEYIFQILKFLLYTSEEKPFPFSDFPEVDDSVPAAKKPANSKKAKAQAETEGGGVAKKASSKKTTAKKAAKKKTSSSKTNPANTNNGAGDS
jgi:hypothetical protein